MTRADQPHGADDERDARRAAVRGVLHRRGERGRAVARPEEYRRFLRFSAIGALIPGVGLIAAGRRVLGWLILLVFLAGLGAIAYYVVTTGRSGLVRIGTDRDLLYPIALGLLVVAAVWLLTAVGSFHALEPRGLRFPQRLLGVLVVVVASSLVVAPLSLGARSAFTQIATIDSVFADEEDQHSLTVPDNATEKDPWAGKPRVNVLILGADSGADREGTRTDTVMVASINTKSGDTALFSLPRNLQYVPFPEGPIQDRYPDGYHGEPESEYWLYSIYRNIPAEFPEVFEGIPDPGAEALKLSVGEALGLDIDYHVMVNLRGFQYLVDALGGIDIDVPYDIPIGTRAIEGVGCTEESGWIRKGDDQHLDGYRALWFARARCGPGPVSDDYERMRRQRCVIGAIAAQADPFRLLTRYQQLATAAEQTMSTDIPQQRLTAFAELALKVQETGIRSLPFTKQIVDYGDPDYDLIRQFVEDALTPPKPSPSASGSPSSTPGGEPTGEQTPGGDETPGGDQTPGGDEPDGPGEPDGQGEPDPTELPTPNETDGAQDIAAVC
ncbi:MAG TPA: LCP family protein [Jiangellaceae bacterium]